MFYEVIPTKIFRAGSGVLTYSSDQKLQPGHLVRIPLGRTFTNGIVIKKVKQPSFPVKPIESLLYPTPLPPHLVKTIFWLSSYYLCPLPTIASLILPVGVDKKRRSPKIAAPKFPPHPSSAPLNHAQSQALQEIKTIKTNTKLLHGVTGSGKTNIYLYLAAETLARGQSVILLVPEISLTSQLVQIFCSKLPYRVTLLHSRQTESERHQIWHSLLTSTSPEIIIGPRSALFAPVNNLGLIIIDEAHESTYFEGRPPRYSTLRLASFMANALDITCLLGTATPLLTDFYLAKNNSALITLSKKAKKEAITPDIRVINLSDREYFVKNRYFSDPLIASIKDNLTHHRESLIFHNRRGSAPLTICSHCGWQALCPTCYLPLTLHSTSYELLCHTCGFKTPLPHSCPACNHPDIIHKGFGTKLLESELKKLFPTAKIARFDADNNKTETLDSLYNEVKNGDFDIIIGTQTVAKGLDLPNLATVGVVQADAGLSLPDYASEERTFHLLTQVIGRVGRGHCPEAHVFIQTYQPAHPIISAAMSADYTSFSSYLLAKRRSAHLPPFFYLARLTVTYKTEATVIKKITTIRNALIKNDPRLEISTPTPAFHELTSSGHTWQLVLKSTSRSRLLAALQGLDPKLTTNLHSYLDPPSLL